MSTWREEGGHLNVHACPLEGGEAVKNGQNLVHLVIERPLVEIWRKLGTKSLILILVSQILLLLFKFVLLDRKCTIELSYCNMISTIYFHPVT